jgi:hypothetical protein
MISSNSPIDGVLDYYNSPMRRSFLSRRMSSVSRVSIPENAHAVLSFHNINYVLKTESKMKYNCCRSQEAKQVLFNVSGQFANGLNAIMGKNLSKMICRN